MLCGGIALFLNSESIGKITKVLITSTLIKLPSKEVSQSYFKEGGSYRFFQTYTPKEIFP